MQEDQNNSSPEQVMNKNTVSIGALLVNARNAMALSQADVADQINLPRSTVDALEKDEFEKLPESTYVRGYLRNYARAVGIDAEGLISTYNEQHHVESEIASRTSTKHSYDSTILWSTAAVLTILVGLLVNWWMDEKDIPETGIEVVSNETHIAVSEIELNNSSQRSNEPEISTNDNVNKDIGETSAQVLSSEEVQTSNTTTNNELNSEAEQAMEDESQNPNLISLNEGADVLTVTYVEKSWTEIRDANLNPLMHGLIEPGVVRNLSGKAPFHVFLGNSPGVIIEVNGQYFDQSQFNRSNRTARFQISNGSLN